MNKDLDIRFQLIETLEMLVPYPNIPVVVHSSAWMPAKVWRMTDLYRVAAVVCDSLCDFFYNRNDLLMPTFSNGFIDGLWDREKTPSNTGIISEKFRSELLTQRTVSSVFSFGIRGPSANHLCQLRPANTWGDDSIFSWLEKENAYFLNIGVGPTHISYNHRLEWIARESISYREYKCISGFVLDRDGREFIKEGLFIRKYPTIKNDFTKLEKKLESDGKISRALCNGVPLSSIRALDILEYMLPPLLADPEFYLEDDHAI